jgi:hypothetical protein
MQNKWRFPPIFLIDAAPWRMATGTHPFGDLFKHEKKENDMTYEVQHYTLACGWINTWLYDEGDGLQPETFASREAAEAALDEYLEELEEEFYAGNIGRYSRDEFRIRYVRISTQPNRQQGETQ